MRKETIAIRGQIERSQYSEHSVPLYLTSSYIFEDAEDMRSQFAEEKPGEIYSRYANPNVQELLDKVALLEGGESAWATASGMAAVFTTFATFLSAGDEIVSSRSVFGSTHRLLVDVFPKWNIKSTYVDFNNYSAYESAITDKTKLVYIETPSNPALDLIDIERLAAICKSKGVLLVVDNCFATPILQQPIKWGADLVIHSTTKFMDGQGRTLGGLIVSSKELVEKLKAFARHSGPAMSPFNAWVISKSIETLDVRMERHCKNALEIAKRLSTLSGISWVKYPFLSSHPDYEIAKKQMSDGGGLVSFELAGGLESGRQFLNKLNLFSLTANLGDTRSIATHPASTTHSKLSPEQRHEVGITDGLIRLSIGLENIEDIWEDIFQACQA
ncbi:MAG: aminotransferase class I/II-fold pyridoxal phosphate-dependent enzyme [Bacteroidetes bacterium]|nr:aminotransferase class I/II-fold pyridoxal phosphate-dependent enzyme [Bacteroidota bacterium]